MGCCQSHTSINLNEIDPSTVKPFSFDGKTLSAKVCNVVDGDTVDIITLFEGVPIKLRLRLLGINCPEIHPKKKEGRTQQDLDAEKERGLESKSVTMSLVNGKIVRIETFKFDNFGRVLAKVYFSNGKKEECLNDHLLKNGYAVVY